MRIVKSAVLMACIGASVLAGVQQAKSSGKKLAVLLPRDVAIRVIVQQLNCPLRIVKFERLLLIDGGAKNRYEVRNEGTKPIHTYYIAELNSLATGYMFGRRIEPAGKYLMPGESDAPDYADDQIEVVPLTAHLRGKLKLEGSVRVHQVRARSRRIELRRLCARSRYARVGLDDQ